jgi:hypothetical protein
VREAVQRNIEDVSAGALESGGKPAELVVVFEQQDAPSPPCEAVRARHSGETASDDDGVVSALKSVEVANWH